MHNARTNILNITIYCKKTFSDFMCEDLDTFNIFVEFVVKND